MKILTDIRMLLLALWLGAACFFVAVAQSAFVVLPSRELGGLLVNRTLTILNLSGLVLSLILLVTSLIGVSNISRILLWAERFFLLLLAATCAVGQFVVAQWLWYIRAQIGRPIDEVPVEDPLRMQFNSVHEYSVWVLIIGMVAALVAFFLVANRRIAAKTKPLADLNFPPQI